MTLRSEGSPPSRHVRLHADASGAARLNLSSGDARLDRRLAYAAALSDAGDPAAAADLLEQTLEIAGDWAVAWFRLGEVRQAAGDSAGAGSAFERASRLDPDDLLGAALKLAALGAAPPPPVAPPAYVRGLFDEYAARFEAHLTGALAYRGPLALTGAIARVAPDRSFSRIVDLGCGTGLMARALREGLGERCGSIVGVDLSPAMVAIARASGLYADAVTDDVERFLEGLETGSRDLVAAADVFVYMGDLTGVFAQAARALAPGGLFAFSIQAAADANGPDYAVGDDMRFSHTAAGLLRLAREQGFIVAEMEPIVLRKDRGGDVPALAAALSRR